MRSNKFALYTFMNRELKVQCIQKWASLIDKSKGHVVTYGLLLKALISCEWKRLIMAANLQQILFGFCGKVFLLLCHRASCVFSLGHQLQELQIRLQPMNIKKEPFNKSTVYSI